MNLPGFTWIITYDQTDYTVTNCDTDPEEMDGILATLELPGETLNGSIYGDRRRRASAIPKRADARDCSDEALTCTDCGATFTRRYNTGPIPRRCPACALLALKASNREGRVRYAIKEKVRRARELHLIGNRIETHCQYCGTQLLRIPGRAEHATCKACANAQAWKRQQPADGVGHLASWGSGMGIAINPDLTIDRRRYKG